MTHAMNSKNITMTDLVCVEASNITEAYYNSFQRWTIK